MKNLKNKKGFTIVELVIVIAVIAILAAVLIPTFSGVITKAQNSAAQQEAAALYKNAYALDLYDGVLDGKEGTTAITTVENKTVQYAVATPNDPASITFSFTASNGKTATFNGSTNTWSVA